LDFELAPLPYAKDALEPHISRETLALHYDKHHRGYLKKLEGLIGEKPEAEQPLEEIVRKAEGDVFNNAAQVWNHSFYWRSMKPGGGGAPPKGSGVAEAIEKAFGSYDGFREAVLGESKGHFGSGWTWLLFDPEREQVAVRALHDADNPLVRGRVPLLALDLWEHAYYVDYRNEKARYFEAFVDELVNWELPESILGKR
jgi:Fe-Mn family superoxide dismutase